VVGAGFPPQAKVEVSFRKRGGDYVLLVTAITNTRGLFESQVVIPTSAVVGERWVVLAAQAIVGEPRAIALSNEFVVSQPKPPAEVNVSIWPAAGPPETRLTVVANGFPAHTQVAFSIGPSGSEGSAFLSTWTEINGTVAGDTMIPAGAAPGENWFVTVNTLGEPRLEASSPIFTVTETSAALSDSVNIFLVDLGGGEIGCGDGVQQIARDVFPTPAPLTAAIEKLITEENRIDPDSGLYNALFLSDLSIESINQTENLVTIRLVGEYQVADECDHPRVLAQIEQTALQYTPSQTVELFINGEPFEELLPQG
jgi:hypothetical protein